MTTLRAGFDRGKKKKKNSVVINAVTICTNLIDKIIVTLQCFWKTRPWIIDTVKQSYGFDIKRRDDVISFFFFFAVHIDLIRLCITFVFSSFLYSEICKRLHPIKAEPEPVHKQVSVCVSTSRCVSLVPAHAPVEVLIS